jgi:hypothetical protein
MKWRAFGRMPQWVRLSEWLGRRVLAWERFAPQDEVEHCNDFGHNFELDMHKPATD